MIAGEFMSASPFWRSYEVLRQAYDGVRWVACGIVSVRPGETVLDAFRRVETIEACDYAFTPMVRGDDRSYIVRGKGGA